MTSPVEWIAWTPFLVAIVVFGVYPQLMFKVMDPAVTQLVEPSEPASSDRRAPRPGVRLDQARRRLARARARARADRRHQPGALIDLWLDEAKKWMMARARPASCCSVRSSRSSPSQSSATRRCGSMFFDRYVVDEYALILKALFLLVGYVIVLMSQTELEEGGYYQGEFYVLLLASVLGMVMMASSRDLVSVFVALELLSIPAYMMAAWRKRDPQVERGGRQVLPARRVRVRRAAVRHVVPVRHDRLDEADRDRRVAERTNPINAMQVIARGVRDRRVRVQGVGRAVPHLGARHLRGCAAPGDRVLVGGVEGGRLRRPGHDAVPRRCTPPTACTSRSSGCSPR